MENKEIQKKIQKLLALSDSSNPFEAQAAALKAQELMLRYNIEVLGTEDESKVVTVKYNFKAKEEKHRRLTHHLLLSSLIAENFRTLTYYGRDTVYFVGFEQDAEASLSVFEFLLNWMDTGFNSYLTTCKRTNPSLFEGSGSVYSKYLKRQWINGFLVGLKESFDKRKADSTFELMLITPSEVKKEYDSLNLRDSNIHVREERNNYEAFAAGVRSGKEALDNRSLENTKIEAV